MGEMSSYYSGQEDPFDPDDTYWRSEREPVDDDGPAQRSASPTKTIWVTKDGKRVKVRDMTDSHLVNTIRYLRRTTSEWKQEYELALYGGLAMLSGEMATYCATQSIEQFEAMSVDEYLEESCPTYPAMLREAEKRGLKINPS